MKDSTALNPISDLDIAIIILAAGASTRMGEPKQLLPWGKSTLLGHSIGLALKSKANSVFVVLGARFEEIKSSIKEHPIKILENKDWRTGMGSSVSLGAKQVQEEGFDGALFVLADQPQVNYLLLNQLITKLKQAQTAKIIATEYENNIGVPAIFHHSFFSRLTMLSGPKGAQSIISQHLQNTIFISNFKKLEDIDTIEQYHGLYKKHFTNDSN